MSFRVRLLISFALLIAITFGIGGALLISISFQSTLEEGKAAAINSYETMQNNLLMLNFFGDDGNYENMSAMLSQMEEQNMAHWQAISLSSIHQSIYESGEQSLLSAELEIIDSNQYAYVLTTDETGRRLRMYSKLSVGQDELFLKASFELSAAYILRENQQRLFFIIYIMVVLLGMGIASILSFALTRRLSGLATVVRAIAGGDFSRRTMLRTGDEFEQLSRDIDAMTDRLQENILRLEEDVERQEAFMGAVAHELKTPMTSIIGYADLIRQCALDENDRMVAANYIYTEGQRLEKLSHKILDLLLLEKDTFSMKEVQLDAFLKEVINVLLPIAEKRRVRLGWKCEAVKVIIEPDLVKSLIYNLVDNAIKSTNDGGAVAVRGRALSDGCEFQIMDNGCGVEEEELSKITEAFYRVDKSRSRKQGGVGLGLTLCKKIVDLHHGNMTFRSTKGKGSCVTVELYNSRRL